MLSQVGIARLASRAIASVTSISLAGVPLLEDVGLEALASALPALQCLRLDGCVKLSSTLPLTRLASTLVSLSLSTCWRADVAPVARLSSLTELDLSGCLKIEDAELVDILSRCRQLIAFQGSGLVHITSSAWAAAIRQRTRPDALPLQCVGLGRCLGLCADSAALLAQAGSHLRVLDMSGCALDFTAIDGLVGQCSNLRTLLLNGTDVNDGLSLACFDTLEQLGLQGCELISDAFLANTISQCTSLTRMDIDGCRHVSDEGLLTLTALTKLSHLNVELRVDRSSAHAHTLTRARAHLPPSDRLVHPRTQ
jgi:Leucine-rich repeat (LRR) protein